MPKLSAYVVAAGSAGAAADGRQQQQPRAAAAAAEGGSGGAAAAPLAVQPPQQQQAQQQQQPAGSPANQILDVQHEAATAKLQADYSKRVREHGPRTFRWPDGSLRPDRPPPNPHAVANRRQWAPLVQHCRTHGGDRSFERTGASLRHGLGVEHSQHAAYLASIGLEPETTAGGEWVGRVPGQLPPMDDPEHCFNTYYREGAEAVFKEKLGRLL